MRLSNVVASELMDLKLRYLLIFSGGYEHRKNNKYRIFYFARATFKTRRTNGDNVHCGKVWNGSLGMSTLPKYTDELTSKYVVQPRSLMVCKRSFSKTMNFLFGYDI